MGVRDVMPPGSLLNFMAGACDIGKAMNLANRWADGFIGEEGAAIGRIHRDGAVGFFQGVPTLPNKIPPLAVARIVDAMLSYLGWIYVKFGLLRPVEIRMEVSGLDVLGLGIGRSPSPGLLAQVPGVDSSTVRVERELDPGQLSTASVRHGMVRDVTDRFVQAFGLDRVEEPFVCGQLYGPDNVATSLELQPAYMHIWSSGSLGLGRLDTDGSVVSNQSGRTVGYWDDGVVVDLDGDTLGVVELATGAGYPDDYFPQVRVERDVNEVKNTAPVLAPLLADRPSPSGRWSTRSLETVLRDVEGLLASQ
jgi:hypothetical protein